MKTLARTVVVALTVVAILSCLCGTVRCQTILVPSQLHIGENNTLLLISESDSTANLALYEKGQSKPVLSQTVHFRKGELVEWSLLLDSQIAFKDKVSIVLTFENGANSVEEFEVSPTNGFVFFQTDKPIYRVSQTVKFRVLRLSRSLTPINERIVLKIQNPQTIKVDEVSLQTRPPYHIAEHSFKFPLIAKPGKWTAELLYGPNLKLRHNTVFEVTEYILPLFKIEIFTPKFVLHKNAAKVNISMKVTYTYGKPVRGTVHYQYHIEDEKGIKTQATSRTICFDGAHNHSLPASLFADISHHSPSRFRVEAIVRECASGAIQSAQNNEMKIVQQPYSISYRKTIRRYKSQVKNYITFEVVDPHNQPVADVPIELNTTGTRGRETIELQPYVVSGDSTNGVKTDKRGQVVMLFKTSDSSRIITVQGRTNDPNYHQDQQTSFSFTIEPFTEKEEESIWIDDKKQLSFAVGNSFQSSITTSGNLASQYLIVMSKGAIVHKKKLTSQNVNFVLTNRMVPSVRVLVLALTPDGTKYVADSVRLDVQAGDCGTSVKLRKEQNRFEDSGLPNSVFPGQSVTFSITGKKDDVIGIHAVDEAVYVLQAEKSNSFSRYSESLEISDSGCGPGEGGNSPDVIRSAGFKVLSPDSHAKNSNNFCKLTYSRKKRDVPKRERVDAAREKFLNDCCKLGLIAPKYNKGSCVTRRQAVIKYTGDVECGQRFSECCKTLKSTQKIQHSATKNTTIPESTSKSEIKIKSEEVKQVDTSMVRHDFRDTWLFDLVLLNDSREATFTRETPHSITSWVVSTFALSQSNGFCMNSDLKVITFKPFFIKVAFPPTMVQHEQTEVAITVFNYNTEKKRQRVSLSFTAVKDICTDEGSNKKPSIQLDVDEMSSARHSFPIVPLVPGIYEIKIQARSSQFTDTVIKNLTVVAPGIEKEKQLTFDLDPLNRAKRDTKVASDNFIDETVTSGTSSYQHTRVNLKVDNKLISSGLNIVPRTLHYIVTAVGERFSPHINSIEELNKLIKKPKGCGEQNMYYMSFNLFTLMYLEKIGKLEPKLREKGVLYLKRALSQQLDFRKDDGSYSAFYKRNSSIWLTAFVAKVMCQSSHFLAPEDLDPVIITTALRWLKSQQNEDGHWQEIQVILHEKALGGVQGQTPLTAYLTITAHECRNYLKKNKDDTGEISEMIEKANTYLAKDLRELAAKKKLRSMDPFSQALIAYSLSVSGEEDAALSDLKNKLIDQLLNSTTLQVDKARNFQHWKGDYPIETASYALMAILSTQAHILDYISIVNWLSDQQKAADGTFDNTQDTIVALEALAKYYARYKKGEDSQLFTNVTYNSRLKRALFFNNSNADVLQTLEVDKDTKHIGFHTRGNGLGKVNVHIIYNEYSDEDICKYFIEVNIYRYKAQDSDKIVTKDAADEDLGDFFGEELTNEIGVDRGNMKVAAAQSKTVNIRLPMQDPDEPLHCCGSRLSKRSFLPGARFWSHISQSIPGRNNGANSNSNGHSKRSEPQAAEQPKFEFSPLPNLGENPNVLVLNICVRHLNTNSNEMAILEVSILSGYTPIEQDLKNMMKQGGSYVAHYEISNSKVTIYLHMVPFGRNYCPYFRIHQEYKVDKIQSALVRIYNYYSQDWTCTRLYSDLNLSKNIPIKCNDQDKTCKCVTDRQCPDSGSLRKILTEPYEDRADKYLSAKCQYSNVIIGRVIGRFQITENYKTPVLNVTVDKIIRGDSPRLFNILIRANPECSTHFETNSLTDVAILHTPKEHDNWNEGNQNATWLLDGESIFLPLDRQALGELESLEYFLRKSKCPKQL